jgi:hypothetical protein
MIRPQLFIVGASFLLGIAHFQNVSGQTPGSVCGSPASACDSTHTFTPYQLPFVIKEKLVFGKTYKSVPFYAVILKSVKAQSETDCSFVPEVERTAAQSQFSDQKVFASRYSCPEELVVYENTAQTFNFLAIYAGTTQTAAKRVLDRVKGTGRYPEAYIKKLRVMLEYST